MNENRVFKIVSLLLIILPLIVIGVRLISNPGVGDRRPDHKYVVRYEFEVSGGQDYSVRTFLPINNKRQQVSFPIYYNNSDGNISLQGDNKVIRWKGETDNEFDIQYTFEYLGKPILFSIDPSIQYEPQNNAELQSYLTASEYIQSSHWRIATLAFELSRHKNSLKEVLQSFYDYVYEMPSAATSELTDAVMALENNKASCNGKSRLFVALCRSMQIPARVTGGLILEETSKKTSHLWAEVFIEDQWVPFDALNGHFASLPAHYLELYKGDEFLVKRNSRIDFDYLYHIKKERVNHYPSWAAINLWEIIDQAKIPIAKFQLLLLLPIGAFVMAVFKNVIGLKTYGVFLPVLISLSLLDTGLISGLILFTSVVLMVALINFPLEKWGVQYNSKVALMLTGVVVATLLIVKVLHESAWLSADAPLFFPIIILTIVSERLARKIEEEGTVKAVSLYAYTLIITIVVYFILSSETIQYFVITFPEIIMSIGGLNLMLGKWIGLRVTEYYRFHKVINA